MTVVFGQAILLRIIEFTKMKRMLCFEVYDLPQRKRPKIHLNHREKKQECQSYVYISVNKNNLSNFLCGRLQFSVV